METETRTWCSEQVMISWCFWRNSVQNCNTAIQINQQTITLCKMWWINIRQWTMCLCRCPAQHTLIAAAFWTICLPCQSTCPVAMALQNHRSEITVSVAIRALCLLHPISWKCLSLSLNLSNNRQQQQRPMYCSCQHLLPTYPSRQHRL